MLQASLWVLIIENAKDKQIDDLLRSWVPEMFLRQLKRICISFRVPGYVQHIVGGTQSSGAMMSIFLSHGEFPPVTDPTAYFLDTTAIHGKRVERIMRLLSAAESLQLELLGIKWRSGTRCGTLFTHCWRNLAGRRFLTCGRNSRHSD
jgi:hypothetical protein